MLTAHFIARVRERIGPHVDPVFLAEYILRALDEGRDDLVTFVGRVNRNGLRCFRLRVEDGRLFYVLLDTHKSQLVTVLPPGFTVGRQNRNNIHLEGGEI